MFAQSKPYHEMIEPVAQLKIGDGLKIAVVGIRMDGSAPLR